MRRQWRGCDETTARSRRELRPAAWQAHATRREHQPHTPPTAFGNGKKGTQIRAKQCMRAPLWWRITRVVGRVPLGCGGGPRAWVHGSPSRLRRANRTRRVPTRQRGRDRGVIRYGSGKAATFSSRVERRAEQEPLALVPGRVSHYGSCPSRRAPPVMTRRSGPHPLMSARRTRLDAGM